MDQEYPYRYGTNLLTASEAKSMFEHALTTTVIGDLILERIDAGFEIERREGHE